MSDNYFLVQLSKLELDPSVLPVNQILLNLLGPPMDRLSLTDYAAQRTLATSPVIGWRERGGKIRVFGNLRSYYVGQRLNSLTMIPTIIVPRDSVPDLRIFAIQTALLSLLSHVMDSRIQADVIGLLWEELDNRDNRAQLSSRFVSKSAMADAVGINRRYFSRHSDQFESKFLGLRGESNA